jgi:hypothetical protein
MPASRVEPRGSFPQLHKILDNLDAQHRLSRFMGGIVGRERPALSYGEAHDSVSSESANVFRFMTQVS